MDEDSAFSIKGEVPLYLPRLNASQLRLLQTMSEPREGPIPAVLDTSCVRTGLHNQLATGRLPASVEAARSGQTRLFMEKDTLDETWAKLPRFAKQLDTPLATVQGMFVADWLPVISVVAIPEDLRNYDERAMAVRTLDPTDFPVAALASLLSPCILLTHNYKHFSPLDVRSSSQGIDAVIAAFDIKLGEAGVQAVLMIPAAPVIAVGATAKWAADKIGPAAWIALALLIVGGAAWYRQQPLERKERIKHTASATGKFLVEEHARATSVVHQAQNLLSACVVPGPTERSVISAVFRKLALADQSLSAQQLCGILDDSVRPPVDQLRRFLHGNKTTMFSEVRRGGFVLGARYSVAMPIAA